MFPTGDYFLRTRSGWRPRGGPLNTQAAHTSLSSTWRTVGNSNIRRIEPATLDEALKNRQHRPGDPTVTPRPKMAIIEDKEMATIVVRGANGASRNTAEYDNVPKKLLGESSKWFKQALENGFKESKEQKVSLPAEVISSVEVFLYWLVERNLILANREFDSVAAYRLALIEAWKFGEEYFIPEFQDFIMSKLYNNMVDDKHTDFHILHQVYDGTLKGSALRELFLHFSLSMTEWNVNMDVMEFVVSDLKFAGAENIDEFVKEFNDRDCSFDYDKDFTNETLKKCLIRRQRLNPKKKASPNKGKTNPKMRNSPS